MAAAVQRNEGSAGMVGRIDVPTFDTASFLAVQSRLTQTPTVTETGVAAGSVQREAQLRLSADVINIQAQNETSASRATFLRVSASLNLVANDLNLPEANVLSPDEFTPDAVAARILDFSSQFLDQARTVEEFNDIFREVEAGIAAGIEQARESLDSVNALTGPVEEAVDEIEQLLSAGLERLATPPDNLSPTSVLSVRIPAPEI